MDEIIKYVLEQYKIIAIQDKVVSKHFEFDEIEYAIISKHNCISISALNNRTDRFVKLDTKKYSRVIERLKDEQVTITNKKGSIFITLADICRVNSAKSKVYGYCRVSSRGQLDNNSLDQQQEEILSKYSNAIIYKEQFTAATTDRPIFNKLISLLKENDTLVVTKLDRLARNTEEGIHLVQELFDRGVSVHVLNVGLLENTSMGKFFLTTLLAVAEMERNTIIERTQTGKAIAKTKPGFKEGRPKKYNAKQLDNALSMLSINGGDKSYTEVAELLGISKSTLIRENNKRKVKELN